MDLRLGYWLRNCIQQNGRKFKSGREFILFLYQKYFQLREADIEADFQNILLTRNVAFQEKRVFNDLIIFWL